MSQHVPDPSSALPARRARGRARSASGLLAVGLLALPLVAWSDAVVVSVDGDEHTLRTYAATVGEVLEQLEVEVRAQDEVVPSEAAPVADGIEIEVDRAITVEVVVGDVVEEVVAPVSTVGEVLDEAGLSELGEAEISPPPSAPVADGDTVELRQPADPVTIEVDGGLVRLTTRAGSVGQLLDDVGIEVGENDRVVPGLASTVEPHTVVSIARVALDAEVEEIVLEHGEERVETDELLRGTTRVGEEGSDGLRLDTYEVVVVDGEEIGRMLVSEEIVEEPRDRVVLVGTFDPPPPSNGDTVWDDLAECEANGNWAHDRGRYHGGLQFHPDTWRRHKPAGYPRYAYQASREQQIEVGERVKASQGWRAWPYCSRLLGLR